MIPNHFLLVVFRRALNSKMLDFRMYCLGSPGFPGSSQVRDYLTHLCVHLQFYVSAGVQVSNMVLPIILRLVREGMKTK